VFILVITKGFPLFTLLLVVSSKIELTDNPAFSFSSSSFTRFFEVSLGTLCRPYFFASFSFSVNSVAHHDVTSATFYLSSFFFSFCRNFL